MLKGIDISMHNGTIDFAKVKSSSISIVIIKATEGVSYIDSYLNQHYNGAKNVGLNVGFYHFMSEKTSPSQQAVDFWNAIKGKQFNVLPCLDIETNNMGRSQKQISDRCIEFLEKFKSLSGLECMIYTGGYFGRDNLDSRVKKYKGWIAHYGVNTPMRTEFEVIGHQYADSGKVNGINGNVDLNNFTNKIFINKEGDYDMDKIVTYFGDADVFAAVMLAQKLNCALVKESCLVNIKAKEVIKVGGPNSSVGKGDRFATFKGVANRL